jgi:hypothetical protein
MAICRLGRQAHSSDLIPIGYSTNHYLDDFVVEHVHFFKGSAFPYLAWKLRQGILECTESGKGNKLANSCRQSFETILGDLAELDVY